MTERKQRFLLIFFSFLLWEVLWYLLFHYSVLMFNFSAESIAYSFSLLFAKQISSGQITKAFYLPHLFIFIANLLIVPLIVGFYVGRHSDNRRLANVVLVILFDMGYNLLSVSLFPVNLYLLSFLSFIMYMSFPIVLAMAYIGAII